MAATAAAPLEVLHVVQLIVHAVAFLYIPYKGIAPSMGVVAAVVGLLKLVRGVVKPVPNLASDFLVFCAMGIATRIAEIVNLLHKVLDSKHSFCHRLFVQKV
jgi:hypothetical protein